MRIVNKTKITLLILFTFITTSFSACGQKAQEPKVQQQQYQTEQESDKVPEQLKSIEGNVEQIIKTLNGPSLAEDKGQEAQGKGNAQQGKDENKGGGQGEQKKQEGNEEGKEGGDKQKEGKEGQDKQQGENKPEQQGAQPKQPPQPQDPWETLSPTINSLHYQWNSYLPMAMKKGASKQLIDNFSSALNSLTNTIVGKNKTNTLMAASYLYAYIPDFYSLYGTEASPEIKRLRHYTRNAMLNAMTANWVQAETDLNNLKATWSLYKNAVPKEQQEISSKLDFSIYEFEKVIKEKNQPLTDIKGRVTLSNIQAMEKESEQKKQK